MHHSKNILVITPNGFSKVNNSKTFETIFSKFEKSDLYCLFFRPFDGNIDFEYCQSYYAVSEADIIKKILFFGGKCGGVVNSDVNEINFKSKYIYKLFKNLSIKYMFFLKSFLWSTEIWNNKDLNDWIISSKVDLVFFHTPNIVGIHKMVRKIILKFDLPLVIYITDDYVIYNDESLIGRFRKYFLLREFRKSIELSSLNYCIGSSMAQVYSDIFKKPFKVLVNSVKIGDLNIVDVRSIPILAYFGGLHLGRDKMLLSLAEILNGLVVIRVYSSSGLSNRVAKKFEKSNIEFNGLVSGKAFHKAINDCDAVLHVESDLRSFITQTMFSISTKLPEYMMSSKLIIGYGPSEIASMKLIYKNKIGLFVNSKLKNVSIREMVSEVFKNSVYRNTLIRNAFDFCKLNFDKEFVSSSVFEELNKL